MDFLARFLYKKPEIKSEPKLSIDNTIAGTINQAGRDINLITASADDLRELLQLQENGQVVALKNLVEDSAEECRTALSEKVLSEVDKILSLMQKTNYAGCDEDLRSRFKLYELIREILLGNEQKKSNVALWQMLERSCYSAEVSLLKRICSDPTDVTSGELWQQQPEIQACIVEVAFRRGYYGEIVKWYDSYTSQATSGHVDAPHPPIKTDLCLFYIASSAFNLRDYHKASGLYAKLENNDTFQNRARRLEVKRMRLASLVMETMLTAGRDGKQRLELAAGDLFDSLQGSGSDGSEVTCRNYAPWLVLLDAFLKLNDDRFWQVYKHLPEELKVTSYLPSMPGLFYERSGKWQDAVDYYLAHNWKESPDLFMRLMACRLILKEPEIMLKELGEFHGGPEYAKAISSLRLAALAELKSDDFEVEFMREWSRDDLTVDDRIEFAIVLDPSKGSLHDKIFAESVLSLVKQISKSYHLADSRHLVGLALLLASFGHHENAVALLGCEGISDLLCEDETLAYGFVERTGPVRLAENGVLEIIQDPSELEGRVLLAGYFIKQGILTGDFLRHQCLCLRALGKNNDALSCAKQWFKNTSDPEAAASIISTSRCGADLSSDILNKCIQVLENSDIPSYVMGAAFASNTAGDWKKADYLAYKSLFLSGDNLDEELLRNWFYYLLRTNERHQAKQLLERVSSACTVSLAVKPVEGHNESLTDAAGRWICLDCESDLINREDFDSNRSLHMEHTKPGDIWYENLLHKKCGDEVKTDGVVYVIKEIRERYDGSAEYVSRIFDRFIPEYVPGQTMNTAFKVAFDMNDPEGSVKTLCEIAYSNRANERHNFEFRLTQYKQEGSQIGLPLDFLPPHGYEDYLKMVRTLLFSNLAKLNATSMTELQTHGPYIVSLSALAVMVVTGLTGVLQEVNGNVLVTNSTTDFVKFMMSEERKLQLESPCSFVPESSNTWHLEKRDPTLVDQLLEMYELCRSTEQIEVSSDERQEFYAKFSTVKIAVEQCHLNPCQIDCIIAARKLRGSVIYDDRFFRTIAAGVCHVGAGNSLTLIDSMIDREKADEARRILLNTGYRG